MASITFVTFSTAKLKQLKDLQKNGIDGIQKMIADKVKGEMAGTMNKMMAGAPIPGMDAAELLDTAAAIASNPEKLKQIAQQKAIEALLKSDAFKEIIDQGLDPAALARLVSGDFSAIVDLTSKLGIPDPLGHCILAYTKGDQEKLKQSVVDLCSLPEINIDKALTNLVVELLTTQEAANGKKIMKQFQQLFVKILEDSIMQGQEDNVLLKELLRQVPQMLEMCMALKDSNINDFIRLLMVLNENLQSKNRKSKMDFGFSPLQIKLLKILALSINKILSSSSSGEQEEIDKANVIFVKDIKATLYELLIYVLKIDPYLIYMMHILFAPKQNQVTKLKITANKHKVSVAQLNENIPTNEIFEVLEKAGKALKISPALLKLLYKQCFSEIFIDEDFTSQISEIFTQLPSNIKFYGKEDREYYTKILVMSLLGLNSLQHTYNLEQKLLNIADNGFNLNPTTAQGIIGMTSYFHLEYHDILMKNKLIHSLASLFNLRIKEFLGMIYFFSGRTAFEEVDSFLIYVCKKIEFPLNHYELLKNLLIIFISQETQDVHEALGNLDVEFNFFTLISRGFLQPKEICLISYLQAGISKQCQSIQKQTLQNLDVKNKNQFINWRDNILQELDKKEKKAQKEKPLPEAMKQSLTIDPQNLTKSKLKEKQKSIIKTQLQLQTNPVKQQVISDLIDKYPDKSDLTKKNIQSLRELASLRDVLVTQGKPQGQIATFGGILGVDPLLVEAVIAIVQTNDFSQTKAGLEILLQGIQVPNQQVKKVCEYGKCLTQEIISRRATEKLQDLKPVLHVPRCILDQIIDVKLDNEAKQNEEEEDSK